MEIRPIRPEDIPSVAALEAQCFPDAMPADMIERFSLSDGYASLVAAEGDAVLGWAALQFVLDEASLLTIASDPGHRRCGVGEALLREAFSLSEKRGASVLLLEVRKSNVPARALYEKSGFQTVGERKNYYENPREDAILMTATIGKEEIPSC